MNKVTIIGAGTVGSEIAAILVKRPDVEMVICDRSGEALDRLNSSTASSQVSTHQIDIQETDQILPLLEGSHTILHAGHPKFNREVMQLALAVNANYIDAAYHENQLEEINGQSHFLLNDEFKSRDLTAVVACGHSPGLSNIVAHRLSQDFTRIDRIYFHCALKKNGRRANDPGLFEQYLPVYAAELELGNYQEEPIIFADQRLQKLAPLSQVKEHVFPEPFGPQTLTVLHHDEVTTLPISLGSRVHNIAYYYPITREVAGMVLLGLTSSESCDINGCRIRPIDLVSHLAGPPITARDDLERDPDLLPAMAGIEIHIAGERASGPAEVRAWWHTGMWAATMRQAGINQKRTGTALPTASLGMVIGADLIRRPDAPRGVIGPEMLDHGAYFEQMNAYGFPVRVEIEERKSVCW